MMREDFVRSFKLAGEKYTYFCLGELETLGFEVNRLPFCIRVLAENLMRHLDGKIVTPEALKAVARWSSSKIQDIEIPYYPSRVLMQDFTGVPAVVDLALMRDAVRDAGKDPALINPQVPVDLVVDHSIQIDYYGNSEALDKNVKREYQRNGERYALLKWAQENFNNFRVVPPNSGICHQVNLEYLSRVISLDHSGESALAFPDTLVGTDSHTPMINGIGVMGWGVGGIEAEAVILGEPIYMTIPQVVGVKLTGELREGVTTTDLVLTVTQLLRQHGVVEKFVEFFGPGMKKLAVPDRATLSNMTPEYGATLGFFPMDEKTIQYMRRTNRVKQAEIAETYAVLNRLFYTGQEDPDYTSIVELDLGSIQASLAGPSRPQDRVSLGGLHKSFAKLLPPNAPPTDYPVKINDHESKIGNGSLVIAAITSCTNTSNPFVMLGAGLVAKKAVEKGLKVPPHVKTSLAPGSRVVQDYLEESGLLPYLEKLGFHIVGFGCTTCIGNSGPLDPEIEKLIIQKGLTTAAVLSGNRNFEARIHSRVRANYLASPMLVVIYALAGRIDRDLINQPLGADREGSPVFLKDLWPKNEEIQAYMDRSVKEDFYKKQYSVIFQGDRAWQALPVTGGDTFQWDQDSSYIKKPPFFDELEHRESMLKDILDARALLVLGDTVTTDHISPAGSIPGDYPAGQYLAAKNISPWDFNSYGSRRGNHEVMMRGTFANVRIKNSLAHPKEGGWTRKFPEKTEMFVYDAAMKYKEEGTPLIVLGGKEYGTGSSRDWAAKGTILLGVVAVIARSYERIHRSNLVGMGVLPLQFIEGDSLETLQLDGSETFFITGYDQLEPGGKLDVKAIKEDGSTTWFHVVVRLNTDVELEYFKAGGILPYVLKKNLSRA